MLRITWLLAVALTFATTANAQKMPPDDQVKADWSWIDAREVPAWWQDAKFGIFIHWGVYSVPAYGIKGTYSEWYWHNKDAYPVKPKKQPRHDATNEFHNRVYGEDFKYEEFAPLFRAEMFDPDHWAGVFEKAGAGYVVLTSKHHDGYTLWPNNHASESFGHPWNSVEVGPQRDLVGELTEAVNKTSVRMGLYYSLWDWFNPVWERDQAAYVDQVMLPQMFELIETYKPQVLFTDGDWLDPYTLWRSPEFLTWLLQESSVKDDIVINDRWGKVRKEHGGYFTTEYGAGLDGSDRPWEENRGIGFSFGYNRNETLEDYSSTKKLVFMLVDIVSRGGNFLLDIGPTADGRIPVIMEDRLSEIGKWLEVNGEAIYGTRKWRQEAQWSEGKNPGFNAHEAIDDRRHGGYDVFALTISPEPGYAVKELFFTQKDGNVYAMLPVWPEDGIVHVRDVNVGGDTEVTMLGVDGSLEYQADDGGIRITLPRLLPGKLPSEYIWTLKISDAN
jgi:alpha-L-fucosidase